MNDIRARFEEIWPVPEGVYWSAMHGKYRNELGYDPEDAYDANLRLDTFTRCQETTDVYVSLVDEMVAELEHVALHAYGCVPLQTQNLIDRASQLKEQKK